MNPMSAQPYVLIVLGIMIFAFARFGTGQGYLARFHVVSQETPAIVLKAFAVLLWLIGGIWILLRDLAHVF